MWYQHSRCKWLQEGDRNTAFFHHKTNIRKRSNAIHSLNSQEQVISDKPKIGKSIDAYSKALFGSCRDPNNFTMTNLWGGEPASDLLGLDLPFSEEEIKKAI